MLQQANNIFFLGIKGVAMANLAVILKKIGKNVTGCDLEEEFITDKLLKDNKIDWVVGFDPKNLPKKTDIIVYSAAHGGTNNPLIIGAVKNNINIISQAKLVGELTDQFETKIAVCGCHGKTTTSSLLVYALNKLSQRPSYLVGAPFFTGYSGGDFQDKKYFVVEADEYGVNPPVDKTPKFNFINPDHIIATNIDFDHPDVYKDIEETKKVFFKFFGNKKIIANIDDPNLLRCIDTSKAITYGESEKANYQIINCRINENESSFEIKNVGEFKISIFGKHNIHNAAAVIVQLLELGFKAGEIKKAILGFSGAERRFEKVYFKNNIYLFDDYAHHPAEIEATINAAKARFKDRRIVVIFQPHTYSRTSNLLKHFNESLSRAGIGLILPIFASAREISSQFKVSSKDIIGKSKNLNYVASNDQLINQLESILKEGDVIFTMGAGNVYKLKNEIIKIINNKLQITNKLQIEKNKDLTFLNTLRSNTTAEYFLDARTREDLIEGKKFALKNKLQVFVLAGGSNLAIIKEKIKGLVIKNNYKEMKIIKEADDHVLLSVSSGYPVSLLVNETVKMGYQGFEYHRGLPGTVGGAIYMNSKWTKPLSYFGDNLESAFLVNDQGESQKVGKKYFNFAYDFSILQNTKEILLEAVFKLKKIDPTILEERARSAFEYRKQTQPMGMATSGCFFKNVDGRSAGQMIDQSGLKGFAVGDFFVSPIHANFIINRGHGQSKDLIKIVKIIKERVKQKFGVELHEEVIII
jgi:UDP-N-acetylmuramate--L-alanine ligase/UDP-N-acetylenolpyruvoylglucosamine reductase